jgi:hypothetical protein
MTDTAYTVWDLLPEMIDLSDGSVMRPAMRKCSYAGIFTGRERAESWCDPSRNSVIVPMHKDRASDWALKAVTVDDFDALRKRYEVAG